MKRKITGLAASSSSDDQLPDGLYLVRIKRMAYRWEKQKPFYAVRQAVLEPEQFRDTVVSGRLYCTPKTLWKLNWFLRDFGYDQELLRRDELDDKAAAGLRGVVKVTHTTVNGRSYQNLEAFAPADEWDELISDLPFDGAEPEAA